MLTAISARVILKNEHNKYTIIEVFSPSVVFQTPFLASLGDVMYFSLSCNIVLITAWKIYLVFQPSSIPGALKLVSLVWGSFCSATL